VKDWGYCLSQHASTTPPPFLLLLVLLLLAPAVDAIKAEDGELRAAYDAYAASKAPFRALAVAAAAAGARYAEGKAVPLSTGGAKPAAGAGAPKAKAAAAPPPPPPVRPPPEQQQPQPARSQSQRATAAGGSAGELEGFSELHADLVGRLRQEGAISGDDATTLRHLFVSADPRLAAAYRSIEATGDVENLVRVCGAGPLL
jgi:hypothetical protein